MIIFKHPDPYSEWLSRQRHSGRSIGFAPTMGALHEGHLSLVRLCKSQNDLCVSSIFVNPTQFNNRADFDKYPISLEEDIRLLYGAGCDVVLIPSVEEMYPQRESKDHFDLGYLEEILEGKYRPGHFQGVCQIVKKLLELTVPTRLYLGQKDFQQCMVIKRLIELVGSNTELVIVPTVREPDGLAMSSRNRRLDPGQRDRAVIISKTLNHIKDNFGKDSREELIRQANEKLSDAGFKTDYVEIASAIDLKPLKNGEPAVALIAAYVDDIRLIDNMLIL